MTMSDRGFSNGGAMFPRAKKTDGAPDFGGDFTIDGELVQHIIGKIKAGEQIKIEISGWKRTDRNGKHFMSLKVRKPWVKPNPFEVEGTDPFGGAVGNGPITSQISKPTYADKQPVKQESPPFFDDNKGDAPWE